MLHTELLNHVVTCLTR